VKEHGIQNAIRNDLVGECFCFRANVGTGWQGEGQPFRVPARMVVAVEAGDVVLRKARTFDTGLPPGFHDLFGWAEVTITPEMVGQTFARFFSIEVKDEKGRMRSGQTSFREAVNRSGGASGVARTVQEARGIVDAAKTGAQL